MRIHPISLVTGFLVFIIPLSPLRGLDVPSRRIQDDSSLRLSLAESWLNEIPARALANRPFIHTLPDGGRVQVRVEEGTNDFGIALARERNGAFPGWAQGSWVYSRSKEDGSAIRIRAFLRSDPYTYVQFRPLGKDKSLIDVVVYEAFIVRSLPIPIPFERLLVIPVEDALTAAGRSFPRRYFDPKPDDYRDVWSFVEGVRSRLPDLSFRDDGAIDDQGRYVFIETMDEQDGTGGLNCSGFAKWVVDGILGPLTGDLLPIGPLKAAYGGRGSSFTAPYEEIRDPFFGLDWTRNLASQANTVLRSPQYSSLDEIEVRRAPFSSAILRGQGNNAQRTYAGFLPNAGFGIEGIHPLLYTLAIDEPGRIYLASISDELNPAPRMRQHYHIAVLVPYFSENGIFYIALFESAEETSFNRFKTRYPGHYVNLVRIPVEGEFRPGAGSSKKF
jgi:hypothetical protein